MPMYDYLCTACEHEFEILQAISDPPPPFCPKCKRETLKKKIVAPSFTFKGGGWYKDLYSNPSPASEKPASSEAAKTESTPAPKETAAPAKKEEAKTGS